RSPAGTAGLPARALLAARTAHQLEPVTGGGGRVLLGPERVGVQYGQGIGARLGEPVVEARPGSLAVRLAGDEARLEHRPESCGQNVVGRAGAVPQLLEAARSGEELAQDQQDPRVPEGVDAARHGARLVGPVRAKNHLSQPPSVNPERTCLASSKSSSL